MRNLFLIGDSNTYGYNSINGQRFNSENRWAGILKTNLKEHFNVVEEGKNGRTGFYKNIDGIVGCFIEYLPYIIKNFNKGDIILLAIGTNDLQAQYNCDNNFILEKLDKIIKYLKSLELKVIIVPPILFDEKVLNGIFKNSFDYSCIEKSKQLIKGYYEISKLNSCMYINFNNFTRPNDIDGLHYDIKSHKIIAEKLTNYILNSNLISSQENNKQ